MDLLQGLIPESWLVWITIAVTICATITTVLPVPAEGGSAIYKIFYNLCQWVALNLGKAKNAQDVSGQGVSAKNVSNGKP